MPRCRPRATAHRLLATEGTVEAGRYGELVHALDAGVELNFGRVSAPRAADRERRPVRCRDDRRGARVRRAAEGRGVDTVILGCTHYRSIRRSSSACSARRDARLLRGRDGAEVAETLARKGYENDAAREGSYRFLTTGRPDAFREMGALPAAPDREVEHVELAR
jgi:glutamate racemase